MNMWEWLARARPDVAQGLTSEADLRFQFSNWFSTLKGFGPASDAAYNYNTLEEYAHDLGWSSTYAPSTPFQSTSPTSSGQAPGANPPSSALAPGGTTVQQEWQFVRGVIEKHPILTGAVMVGALYLVFKPGTMSFGRK